MKVRLSIFKGNDIGRLLTRSCSNAQANMSKQESKPLVAAVYGPVLSVWPLCHRPSL